MANFVAQDPNLRLPGQPWTSAKAIADAENLEAVAEGSPDAYRIRSGSLDFRLATVDPSGLANVTFTDLPPAPLAFEFSGIQPDSASARTLRIEGSVNNGANWTQPFIISASGTWQATGGARLPGLVGGVEIRNTYARFQTGAFFSIALGFDNSVDFLQGGFSTQITAPFQHLNAVRFSWSSGSFRTADNQAIRLYAGGNRHAPKP